MLQFNRVVEPWIGYLGDVDAVRYPRSTVLVYQRTKRSIIRRYQHHATELIAAGPADWQRGTITLNK